MIPFPVISSKIFQPFIIVGGNQAVTESGTPTTKMFDLDGNLIWATNWGNRVYSVSGNGQAKYVTGGFAVPSSPLGDSIATYNQNGVLQITFGQAETIGQALSVDYEGSYIYTGSNDSAVRKWNDLGVEQWQSSCRDIVNGIKADGSGYVYTADEAGYFTKWSPTGSLVFEVNIGGFLRSVDLDSSYIYVGGSTGASKLSSTGSVLWSVGTNIFSIKVDSSGNLYTGDFNGDLKKYNSSGTLQWTQNHGAIIRGVGIDKDDNVYIVGNEISSISFRKYNSSGTLLWSRGHNQGLYSIDIN